MSHKNQAVYIRASKRVPDQLDGMLYLKLKGKESGKYFYYAGKYLEISECEYEEDLLLFDVGNRTISAYLSEIEYLIVQDILGQK